MARQPSETASSIVSAINVVRVFGCFFMTSFFLASDDNCSTILRKANQEPGADDGASGMTLSFD